MFVRYNGYGRELNAKIYLVWDGNIWGNVYFMKNTVSYTRLYVSFLFVRACTNIYTALTKRWSDKIRWGWFTSFCHRNIICSSDFCIVKKARILSKFMLRFWVACVAKNFWSKKRKTLFSTEIFTQSHCLLLLINFY